MNKFKPGVKVIVLSLLFLQNEEHKKFIGKITIIKTVYNSNLYYVRFDKYNAQPLLLNNIEFPEIYNSSLYKALQKNS